MTAHGKATSDVLVLALRMIENYPFDVNKTAAEDLVKVKEIASEALRRWERNAR